MSTLDGYKIKGSHWLAVEAYVDSQLSPGALNQQQAFALRLWLRAGVRPLGRTHGATIGQCGLFL